MSDQQSGDSLTGRLAASVRGWEVAWRDRPAAPFEPRRWMVPAGVALLLAAGPLATIIGAKIIAGNARADAAQLDKKLAPRIAAAKAAASDRAELIALLRRPGLGQVADALARALPPEASVQRIERNQAGLLEVEISTPDPDRIRAAIRREPALAGLRDAGQRQVDVMMVVTFRERAR
ncbi:hypothetical protein [Sphingomonas sp. G-3-2-10]|uniref:hypothetical protein n=1 Tax=Sphingomonas sp. G-3-2-10 TaxID=2728838 RepID=UPI00146BC7DA|nr:hypothetical protein [Sphingomonas sp. G-3-2-10]NML05665.1 hypothetical protein [Sphingomonas sp. G-3-2-10]